MGKKRKMGSKKRLFCGKDFGKLFKIWLGKAFGGTMYTPAQRLILLSDCLAKN